MMEKKKQMSIEVGNQQTSTSYLRTFKNTIKKLCKIVLFIFILMFLNVGAKTPVYSKKEPITEISDNYANYPNIVRQRLQTDLINEVQRYIEFSCPGSKLNAEKLVSLCQEYKIDITFVLAQGVLESHLGTKGKAVSTKSIWNVGAYDNGVVKYRYTDVNESIEPYLKLLNEEYLGNKKKISDLLKEGGFKNLHGHRYATSIYYESRLRTYMVHVDLNSSINMYEDVMNLTDEQILAYFGPIETYMDEYTKSTNLYAKNKTNDTSKRKF